MSTDTTPAAGAVSPATEPPLDDVMIAMDMVDLLRREEQIIARELNVAGEEEALIKRMKEIYAAQGIDVTDDVLRGGLEAARRDRFKYEPAPPGWQRWLAEIYIDRGRWLLRLGTLAVIGGLLWGAYWMFVEGPRRQVLRDTPVQIADAADAITREARVDGPGAKAKQLADEARGLLQAGQVRESRQKLQELQELRRLVESEYELRIVAQGSTGVFREPKINQGSMNYYIIVEAVTPDNTRLTLPIKSEETNLTSRVSKWGLRVDEFTFQQVENDKKDDGIIQNNRFGQKKRGYLEPEFLVPSTGGAITAW